MPEQDELHCARCGDFWPWDGETRENICGSCQADEAEAGAAFARDYEALLDAGLQEEPDA